jgi:GNAT superfamily N-acetyltransferase
MEPTIRIASERDLPAIERVVYDAYKGYIPLIGKPPAPMSDDYGRQIEAGNVWVLLLDDQLVGLVLLVRQGGHVLLDNVAVTPERQGCGLGRTLIDFLRRRSGRADTMKSTCTQRANAPKPRVTQKARLSGDCSSARLWLQTRIHEENALTVDKSRFSD